MIDASFYQGIYLFIVTLLTLITVSYRRSLTTIEPIVGSVILCIFLVLFIGFRPVSYLFVDMMNYNSWWGLYEWEGFDWGAQNVLFDNLYAYMSFSHLWQLCILFLCLLHVERCFLLIL